MVNFKGKKVLVCGGTGSIGSEIVRQLIDARAELIRVFARDETKHQQLINSLNDPPNLRSLIGDIRDKARLNMAMEDIDIVFHAAALKSVPFCEYNPTEAVLTNVLGTQNIIETALDHNVERVITISTDKAAEPTNTLGATKLLSERITASADFYRGYKQTLFAAVRFGNVLGSRNSLIPLIKEQILQGKPVTLTDTNMTRFIMSIPQAVKLVFKSLELSQGGEVFILKMPTVYITDLINIFIEDFCKKQKIDRKVEIKKIGIRPGEKLYEKLLSEEEAESAYENEELFLISSRIAKPNEDLILKNYPGFKKTSSKSVYNSQTAPKLSKDEIQKLLSDENLT